MQCLAELAPSLVKGKRNEPLVTDETVGTKLLGISYATKLGHSQTLIAK